MTSHSMLVSHWSLVSDQVSETILLTRLGLELHQSASKRLLKYGLLADGPFYMTNVLRVSIHKRSGKVQNIGVFSTT